MPKRRRRATPKKRRRRTWLRVLLGLVLIGLAFVGAAAATLWLAESSGIFATDLPGNGKPEEHSAEDRRALEDILKQRAPQQP